MTNSIYDSGPVVFLFPNGAWGVGIHVFPHPDGVYYVEAFYDIDIGGRPAHILPGPVEEIATGYWSMGDGIDAFVLDDEMRGHSAHDRLMLWKAHLEEVGGEDIGSVLEAAKRNGAMVPVSFS